MQFNLTQSIQDVKSAQDITTILQIVKSLEKEVSAGGYVGHSAEALQEIAAAARARSDELQAASDQALAEATRRVEFARQAATLDPAVVTVELLKGLDGHAAWSRDDYLSMRGICGGDRPKLAKFLDRVAEVKAQAKAEGVVFIA